MMGHEQTTRFSTDDAPQEDRRRLLQEHTGRNLLPLALDSAKPDGVHGSLTTRSLGEIRIGHIVGREHVASRTQDLISREPSGIAAVSILVTGQAFFYHPAGYGTLDAGGVAVVDADEPCIMGFTLPSSMVFLHVPVALQPEALSRSIRHQPTRLLPEQEIQGPSRTARNLLSRRIRGAIDRDGPFIHQDEAASLLRLAAATVTTPAGLPGALGHPTLAKALSYITEHAHEPDLTVDRIAEAVFTSRRQLSRLFVRTGLTARDFILQARLDRALYYLSDETAHRTIAEVARDSGFSSASNFSRAFRSVFGTSPRSLDYLP